jgi:hypothetical protein
MANLAPFAPRSDGAGRIAIPPVSSFASARCGGGWRRGSEAAICRSVCGPWTDDSQREPSIILDYSATANLNLLVPVMAGRLVVVSTFAGLAHGRENCGALVSPTNCAADE